MPLWYILCSFISKRFEPCLLTKLRLKIYLRYISKVRNIFDRSFSKPHNMLHIFFWNHLLRFDTYNRSTKKSEELGLQTIAQIRNCRFSLDMPEQNQVIWGQWAKVRWSSTSQLTASGQTELHMSWIMTRGLVKHPAYALLRSSRIASDMTVSRIPVIE